jgi:hypothetical protein
VQIPGSAQIPKKPLVQREMVVSGPDEDIRVLFGHPVESVPTQAFLANLHHNMHPESQDTVRERGGGLVLCLLQTSQMSPKPTGSDLTQSSE